MELSYQEAASNNVKEYIERLHTTNYIKIKFSIHPEMCLSLYFKRTRVRVKLEFFFVLLEYEYDS